jgi:hypothetical protein
MADLFHSPYLTLIRAKYHIDQLNAELLDFINSQPWAYVVDEESQPGTHIHKIKFTRQLSEMWPCILFDAVNNLRAVLDQVGYAAAVAAKRPSTKSVKFPFGPTEEKWRNNLAGGCKDLPAEIRDYFEIHKAYKGGNNTLWALNEIANAKKHLALVPIEVSGIVSTIYADIDEARHKGFIVHEGSGWDTQKNETVLLYITPPTGPIDPQFKFNIGGHFTYSIAIGGIETVGDRPVMLALKQMSGMVEGILFGVEAECRRLGFQLSQ